MHCCHPASSVEDSDTTDDIRSLAKLITCFQKWVVFSSRGACRPPEKMAPQARPTRAFICCTSSLLSDFSFFFACDAFKTCKADLTWSARWRISRDGIRVTTVNRQDRQTKRNLNYTMKRILLTITYGCHVFRSTPGVNPLHWRD